MSQTDKTGAPTTVTAEPDRYTIAVDGKKVGKAEFLDRDGRRIFTHTEVDKDYEGRGLATILIARGAEGDPCRRAAHRAQMPDGRRLRRQARRVPGHRRRLSSPAQARYRLWR